MRGAIAAVGLAGAILVGSAGICAAQTVVRVTGSTTVNALVFKEHKDAIESSSGTKLEVIPNGSGKGLTELAAGRSDVAMLSSPMDAVVKHLNEKQPGMVDASGLKEHRIGKTKVIFFVHPSNPVKRLTLAQIKDIYSGKATSWKDVGGADQPIVVVTEAVGGGIRTAIEDKVLGGGVITDKAKPVVNVTQAITLVKQLPGAIGFVGAKQGGDVSMVETDSPLELTLVLVTKGAPNPSLTKVIDATIKVLR